MAFCGSCGSANPDDVQFCPKCGAALHRQPPLHAAASASTPIVLPAASIRHKKEIQIKAGAYDSIGKIAVWIILLACIVVFLLAIILLPGTRLGFALAFGSGILVYECVLVLRKIASRRRTWI